jgi:hypothetical protein
VDLKEPLASWVEEIEGDLEKLEKKLEEMEGGRHSAGATVAEGDFMRVTRRC